MLTEEREKELKNIIYHSYPIELELFDEIYCLRHLLEIATEALEKVKEFGKKAYEEGTLESHSLHLGMCMAVTDTALEQIKEEKNS